MSTPNLRKTRNEFTKGYYQTSSVKDRCGFNSHPGPPFNRKLVHTIRVARCVCCTCLPDQKNNETQSFTHDSMRAPVE